MYSVRPLEFISRTISFILNSHRYTYHITTIYCNYVLHTVHNRLPLHIHIPISLTSVHVHAQEMRRNKEKNFVNLLSPSSPRLSFAPFRNRTCQRDAVHKCIECDVNSVKLMDSKTTNTKQIIIISSVCVCDDLCQTLPRIQLFSFPFRFSYELCSISP